MEYHDYIKMGLNGKDDLKLILCGRVERENNQSIGIVSVVFATYDRKLAEVKLNELNAEENGNYYMVYSVPLNEDLTLLEHYPSIEISQTDLA